jgi:hypothetical protein
MKAAVLLYLSQRKAIALYLCNDADLKSLQSNQCGEPANFKGGDVHHYQETPVFGQTGLRWVGPRRGKISVACDQADSGRWG